MQDRVVFRVDAGQIPHVATGHAFRCLALADELATRGLRPLFLMRDEPSGTALVTERGFEVETIPMTAALDVEIAALSALKPAFSVFDLIQAPVEQARALSRNGCRVTVIDDLGSADLDCDLVINGSLPVSRHRYPRLSGRLLAGGRFTVLGCDFDNRRHAVGNDEVSTILVTLGGADPRAFTPIVVNSLVEKGLGKVIEVVKGPAYGNRPVMGNVAQSMKTQVRVQENVPDLSILMMAADLVVSAAGRTAYELAATGTPCVLVPTAPHEEEVARHMAAAGAALAVSAAEKESLIRELPDLVKSSSGLEARRGLAQAARRLIDGQGRLRVAQAIIESGSDRAQTGWGKD